MSYPAEPGAAERGELEVTLWLPQILVDGRQIGGVSTGRDYNEARALSEEAGETPFLDLSIYLTKWEHRYTVVLLSGEELETPSVRLINSRGGFREALTAANRASPLAFGTSANGGAPPSSLAHKEHQAEFVRVHGETLTGVEVVLKGTTHSLPVR